MPEGPELLHSRDELRNILIAERPTVKLNVASGLFCDFGGRYRNERPTGFNELSRLIERDGGIRVFNINVKGKLMWWEMGFAKLNAPSWWMHCTYGMSGQWIRGKQTKHVGAVFQYYRASDNAMVIDHLSFVDPRHFGTIKFIDSKEEHEKKLASLGPDMLSDPPDVITFGMCLNKTRRFREKTIVEALMNQTVISGVGNYIKAEALYRAGISPHRVVASLLEDDLTRLRQAIIDVMQESYAAKGASIRTYRTTDNEKGSAQFQFRVYGQERDPQGHAVVREETQDGRTTHWVPEVQT